MKIGEIFKFISSLRKTRQKLYTNYYMTLQNSDKDFAAWYTDTSIVFCDEEENFVRCYFASVDLEDLNSLFVKVPKDSIMDYVVKGAQTEFSWVGDGLFKPYTTLVRHTNPDLYAEHPKTKKDIFMEQFYQEDFGEFATEKDAEELYKMLYEIFDCRVSRLPSKEELKEQIQKNWVLLYRENGEIIAFLMYQMVGKKYYGYQIYNCGTADITYNLERRAIKYAMEHYDARSSYSWTERGNLGANKRAGQCDGTYDYIFIKS